MIMYYTIRNKRVICCFLPAYFSLTYDPKCCFCFDRKILFPFACLCFKYMCNNELNSCCNKGGRFVRSRTRSGRTYGTSKDNDELPFRGTNQRGPTRDVQRKRYIEVAMLCFILLCRCLNACSV